MTKILAWNIQSGGGTRWSAIADAIHAIAPDIAVLSEFRNGNIGERLLGKLKDHGLQYVAKTPAAPNENTVLLISKIPFQTARFFPSLKQDAHRLVEVDFPSFSILGFYFPQREAKRPVFEHLIDLSKQRINTPALWLGDLNTGKHRIDEAGTSFYCSDYLGMLEQAGHIDTWRDIHGNKHEYTWFSHAGNGFRIDHAFATPALHKNVKDVRYLHNVRTKQLSDHSALFLELE